MTDLRRLGRRFPLGTLPSKLGGNEPSSAAAAVVESQESSVTHSSNPLHAWAGAKLSLRNESGYSVSYWVVDEDKLTSTVVKRRVFRNIEDHLNEGVSDLTHAKHNARHGWDMINAEHALDNEVSTRELCACSDGTARLGRC